MKHRWSRAVSGQHFHEVVYGPLILLVVSVCLQMMGSQVSAKAARAAAGHDSSIAAAVITMTADAEAEMREAVKAQVAKHKVCVFVCVWVGGRSGCHDFTWAPSGPPLRAYTLPLRFTSDILFHVALPICCVRRP
jgi:hypothetical protein